MRIFFSVVMVLFFFTARAQLTTVDSTIHLYLLIGQSNMAGRGTPDAQSKVVNSQIAMMDSLDRWIPATDPVHFDKPEIVGVGPAISFAMEMLDARKDITIGLIPCALGGSPIEVWRPGTTYLKNFHPYDDAIRRSQIGIRTGVLKGILWHQGESDNDSVRARVYLQQLKVLVNRIRTELAQPTLPFIVGEIGYFNKDNYINPVLNQVPQQIPYTAVVSAKGLTDKGDHLHFDTSSARILGKRYAEAMRTFRR